MTYKMRTYLLRMHRFDTKLCLVFNYTSDYRIIRHFFRIVSRLGDGIFWYGLMALLLATEGMTAVSSVLHMALAGLSGTLLYKWIKGQTLRPRPYQVQQDIRLAGNPLDKFSFPSGHTLHAVVFSFIALSYYPLLTPFVLPFTVLIGLSRVVLGLHYPSDVFAGALLGWTVAYLSFGVMALF